MSRAAVASELELRVEREAGASQAEERTWRKGLEMLRIGSHASNELVLADPSVSRFHCRLSHDAKGWRVTDLGSLNGTRVQGVRIFEAELPSKECVLELGDSTIRVREISTESSVEILDRPSFGELFGTSVVMRKLFAILDRVGQSETNVLIEGESGTGKELVAAEIVRRGPRARKPFVIVDCSAISPNLIESELFGHARGAFTGADRDRIGAFEAAHGGTVFLDEIGEMPIEMQPKLLRALEAREVRRIGETATRKVDVRVVAATNRHLEREVNNGRFREDLYFRLSVVTLRVPPLRDRLEDIDLLIRTFLETLGAQTSAHLFTRAVLDDLARYDWPGNVRELRNYVERTVVLQTVGPTSSGEERRAALPHATGTVPAKSDVDISVHFRTGKERVIAEFEKNYVTALLEWADGNISRASRKAAMDRMNLYRLIQRYGLRDSGAFKDDG
jgi:transcriptional regulator with GAF, ATPase, and Fis domain